MFGKSKYDITLKVLMLGESGKKIQTIHEFKFKMK
jgi:hypothetical protein